MAKRVRCMQFAPRPVVVPEGKSAQCVRHAGHEGNHEGYYEIRPDVDGPAEEHEVEW